VRVDLIAAFIASPKSGGGKANESFLAEARARGIETVVLRPATISSSLPATRSPAAST
jgi:hypothetical protein